MLTENTTFESYDMCIGIDTDSKSYAVTYLSNQGERSLKMPAHPKALHQYFRKRFPDKRLLYVYEAGATGYDLYDYLNVENEACWIVHPPSVKKAPNDRVKNNRIDSHTLAMQGFGRQIEGIRVPEEPYRELRHLAVTRQQYVEDARRIKQRIRSLLLFEHISGEDLPPGKHWSKRFRLALKHVSVKNETIRFKLDTHLEDLEYVHNKLLHVHKQLRYFYLQHTDIQAFIRYLRSIPGFGFAVSAYLLARIGNPKYLRNVRELGAFAGVVPTEHSTGETVHKGSITHMGDATLRSLLIEAAWIAIRKDAELGAFYYRIRARHPFSKGSKLAIVAVARKLTHRAYRVLKEQRSYVIH